MSDQKYANVWGDVTKMLLYEDITVRPELQNCVGDRKEKIQKKKKSYFCAI